MYLGIFLPFYSFVHIIFTFDLLIALLSLMEVWRDSSVHADAQ